MNIRYNSRQKRDDNGKKLCKVCESALPPRRSSYCSDECALRNNPGWIRQHVYWRDKGVCALCGVDTKINKPAVERYGYGAINHDWEADHIVPVSEGGGLCGLDGYRTLCKACHGKETGKLRKRLNERKRVEKHQRETGKLF